jgi:hypothetical protein
VGLFARFCLHVPLPLTLAAAGLFLLKQHASGAAFRHDQAHQVIRFIDLLLLLAVSGAALLTAGIIFACTRRRLARLTRWAAGVGAVLSLAAVVLAFAASESVFQRAKSRAYAAVDAAALRADCAAMAAAPGPFVTAGEKYFGGTHPGVPPYTRSLQPKYVRITRLGVWVTMRTDPIAGAYEEGYFVPLAPIVRTPEGYVDGKRVSVISSRPPVFRYSSR